MKRIPIVAATPLLAWACMPASNQQQNETPPAVPQSPVAPAAPATSPSATLPEPKGPIDAKSTEAAGQIVQSYGALIEQKRWSEANALWGHAENATAFQAALGQYRNVHLEIGDLGEPEGAAGSIFVTMPVVFYGDGKDGKPLRRSAIVTLRRVNDVDGSTEAQRRWHIDRIDWAA